MNRLFSMAGQIQPRPYAARLALPLFLTALSLGLNLHALAADSFWGDEIFTASYASRSPTEVIRWTANDIHPPLYYLLAGAFARLTTGGHPDQVSDWLWRFPSVMAGVLAVAVTFRLAGRLASASRGAPCEHLRTVAAVASLLLCLSPVAIKYGQEARMHALFMLLSALSTWLFFRALARPGSRSRWLAFGMATAANIYTMYFGFLILAAQAGLLLFVLLAPDRPGQALARLAGFAGAGLLALALYAPWWPVLFSILRQRAAVGAIEGGVGSPLAFIPGVVQALGPAPAAWLFLLLFLGGVVLLARRYWPLAAFAALWLVLPTLLPILLGDPRALQFRYAFVLPVYLAVIAYALTGLSHYISRLPIFRSNGPAPDSSHTRILGYLAWLLLTLSFIGVLAVYNQTKPDWRGAAAYLEKHAAPADTILVGPLWDEGRFIGYYYRGQAKLLTPAAFVANIDRYAAEMRTSNGRVWALNRFTPVDLPALKNIPFSGLVVSEPLLAVYEPEPLTMAAIHLARQAVEAAYPWAARSRAQGVLNPDPRTAQAAALRALGDTLVAAGRLQEALEAYQTAVDIFPGWVNGFIVLAETQEAAGNVKAAAEAYRQAVNFNLKWHGAEAEKAAALVEAGQWAAAVEHYHQIIKGR